MASMIMDIFKGAKTINRDNGVSHGQPMPDSFRLILIIAMGVVHQDMSLPILYSSLIHTSYACDLFTLWGIMFGVSSLVSLPMQLVSGWIADFAGDNQHRLLASLAVVLGILQLILLCTSDVWLLGAVYVTRSCLIAQFGLQKFKLLKTRYLYSAEQIY